MNNIFRDNYQARENLLIKFSNDIKLEDEIKTKKKWNIIQESLHNLKDWSNRSHIVMYWGLRKKIYRREICRKSRGKPSGFSCQLPVYCGPAVRCAQMKANEMSLVAVSEYMEEAKPPQRDDLFNVKDNTDTGTNGKI